MTLKPGNAFFFLLYSLAAGMLLAGGVLASGAINNQNCTFADMRLHTLADGRTLSYRTSGHAGQTILMLSSLGRPVSDFTSLACRLSEAGYTIVAVDVPGVAASSPLAAFKGVTLFDLAGDIAAIVPVFKGDNEILVIGHAFGNRLARAFTTRYSDKVSAIALLASGGAQDIRSMPKVAKAMKDSFDKNLPAADRRTAIKYAFFADSNHVPDEWLMNWYAPGAEVSIAAVRNTPEELWRDGGGQAPMLVLQAENDRIAPAHLTSDLLLAQYPDRVKKISIPNAGHALLPEQPDLVFLAISDFFHSLKQE